MERGRETERQRAQERKRRESDRASREREKDCIRVFCSYKVNITH